MGTWGAPIVYVQPGLLATNRHGLKAQWVSFPRYPAIYASRTGVSEPMLQRVGARFRASPAYFSRRLGYPT
eukprot:1657619-Alexandrium_andersonii.AAC.1